MEEKRTEIAYRIKYKSLRLEEALRHIINSSNEMYDHMTRANHDRMIFSKAQIEELYNFYNSDIKPLMDKVFAVLEIVRPLTSGFHIVKNARCWKIDSSYLVIDFDTKFYEIYKPMEFTNYVGEVLTEYYDARNERFSDEINLGLRDACIRNLHIIKASIKDAISVLENTYDDDDDNYI